MNTHASPFAALDVYDLRHLVSHLADAGRGNDIHRLLVVDYALTLPSRPERTVPHWYRRLVNRWHRDIQEEKLLKMHQANAWYAAHEQMGDLGGYRSDILRALELVENELRVLPGNHRASPLEIRREDWGLLVRYALILASLNSQAMNLPAPLLSALVREGLWSPTRALAIARSLPDVVARGRALAALAPVLEESDQIEIFKLILALEDPGVRLDALVRSAGALPVEMFESAFDVALDSPAPFDQLMLSGLVPYLVGDLPQKAVRSASQVQPPERRARLLGCLASILDEETVWLVLSAVKDFPDAEEREALLRSLAQRLAELGHVKAATEVCQSIQAVAIRVACQVHLASYLPVRRGRKLLEASLALVKALPEPDERIRTMTGLPPNLLMLVRNQAVEQASDFALEIDYFDEQHEVLADLAPWLAKMGDLEMAYQVAIFGKRRDFRAQGLINLSPFLTRPMMKKAFREIQEWNNREDQDQALSGLAPRLAALGDPQEALRHVESMQDISLRVGALVEVAGYLPSEARRDLLERTASDLSSVDDVFPQTMALAALGSALPSTLLRETLVRVKDIPPNQSHVPGSRVWIKGFAVSEQAWGYHRLLPALVELGDGEEAYKLARSIPQPILRMTVLEQLAQILPDSLSRRAHREALAVARSVFRVYQFGLESMVQELRWPEVLPDALAREILRTVQRLPLRAMVITCLVELLPRFPEPIRREAVQTLSAAWQSPRSFKRLKSFVEAAAPYLPEHAVRFYLSPGQLPSDPGLANRLLEALLPRLAELGYPREALDGLDQVAGEVSWTATMSAIVASIPEELLREARERLLARDFEDPYWVTAVHSALAVRLAALGCIVDALEEYKYVHDSEFQVETLAGMAPFLSGESLDWAVEEVRRFPEDHELALAQLSLQLVRYGFIERGMEIASSIDQVEERASALTGLVAATRPEEQASLCAALLAPSTSGNPLRRLASRTRWDLLSDLRAIFPLFVEQAGKESAEDFARAIIDAGEWWPAT